MQQVWEGTPEYAPPEQLKYLPIALCGFKVPTHPYAADAWGVGMLTAEVRPLSLSPWLLACCCPASCQTAGSPSDHMLAAPQLCTVGLSPTARSIPADKCLSRAAARTTWQATHAAWRRTQAQVRAAEMGEQAYVVAL